MPVLQVPHPFQTLLTTVSVFHSFSRAICSSEELPVRSMPSAYGDETKERSKSKRSHWVSVYAANLHLIHGTGISKVEAKQPENCQSKLKIRGEYKLSRRTVPVFAQYQYLSVFCYPSVSTNFFICWSRSGTPNVNSCGLITTRTSDWLRRWEPQREEGFHVGHVMAMSSYILSLVYQYRIMVKLCWTVELIISLMIWHCISVYPHEMLTHQPTGIFPSISQYLSLTPPKHLPGNCPKSPIFFPVTSVPPSVPATIWPSSQARRLLSHHPRNPEEVADQRRRANRLQIPSEGDFLFLTWRPWRPWHHGIPWDTMGPGENLGKCGNSWWETPWIRWKYEVNSEKMEENDDSLWGGLAKPCESHGKIGSELMLIQFWGGSELWKKRGIHLRNPECKAKKTGSELRKLGINPSSDAEFWLRKWENFWVPAAVDERMVRRFQ